MCAERAALAVAIARRAAHPRRLGGDAALEARVPVRHVPAGALGARGRRAGAARHARGRSHDDAPRPPLACRVRSRRRSRDGEPAGRPERGLGDPRRHRAHDEQEGARRRRRRADPGREGRAARTRRGARRRARRDGARRARAASCCPGFVQAHVHLCQALLRGTGRRPAAARLAARAHLAARGGARRGERSRRPRGSALRRAAPRRDDHDPRHGHRAPHDAVFEALAATRHARDRRQGDDGRGRRRAARAAGDDARDSLDESVRAVRALARRGGRPPALRVRAALRAVVHATTCSARVADAAPRARRRASTRTRARASASCALVRERCGEDNVAPSASARPAGPRTVPRALRAARAPTERRRLARARRRTSCTARPRTSSSARASPRARAACAAGVAVGLGADGAPCNNNLDALRELRLAALLAQGRVRRRARCPRSRRSRSRRSAARAPSGSTTRSARSRSASAPTSSSSTCDGHARARPAATRIASVVYAARATDVRHVLVDGRVLVEDGQLQTLDESAIQTAARREAPLLARRAKLGSRS